MKIDSLSDLATKIRNGLIQRKLTVEHCASFDNLCVLDILYKEGYINGYRFVNAEKYSSNRVIIFLKYKEYVPAIKEIKRISTPGKRIYTTVKLLKDFKTKNFYSSNELNDRETGIYILSTNLGIISSKQALQLPLGGELLLKIS